MNSIFLFEVRHSAKRWATYLVALVLVFLGVYAGVNFNLSVGEGIFLNSAYNIGFMTGILSLSILFFAILFSNQLLFKAWDTKFDLVLFALPFSKWTFLNGNFWFLFLKTFLSFTVLILGFAIGQNLRVGSEMQAGFNLWHYLYPLLIFGVLNCFFVCSFLFFIGYTTKKKLLVVVGGLLLYVFYMVLLVFSNSPFMAGSLPQSIAAQQLSALLDPFGLSAYFFEARLSSVLEKNELIVPFTGVLFLNRMATFLVSGLLLWISYGVFSFSKKSNKRTAKSARLKVSKSSSALTKFISPSLNFESKTGFKSVLSFSKIDLIYLFKSITIVATSILLVFYVGMEMYAEIDKGIRLPENYASSGILATAISENFHLLGLLILVYFINDMYWRSQASNFNTIEKSTFFSRSKLKGHLLSISVLLFFLTGLLLVEAVVFQWSYNYLTIDYTAYFGVILFNTFPLILFSAFLLLINDTIRNRFISLGVSIVLVFVLASPFSKQLIPYPLLHIFSGYKGVYSDFNGYGIYITAFSQRLLFGLGIIALLWLINDYLKTRLWKIKPSIFVSVLLIFGVYNGVLFMNGYVPKNEAESILEAAQYEKAFRSYETKAQPTITDVTTEIKLYPSKNAYKIQGKYVLKNQTQEPIEKVLINFNADLTIEAAQFSSGSQSINISDYVTEITLNKPLQPNEEASLDFSLAYKWFAVNGHQSFNAIVKDGSFMRISRYYPSFGYQKYQEIEDEQKRAEFQLGKASAVKKLEAPEVFDNNFINLNMTLSTETNQIAIGTGDLIKKWTNKDRNYFQYKAENIPFRFAVSSAEYQHKSVQHDGIAITVYYLSNHFENVDHLLKNAVISLDYCTENFGGYPFKSINFVEISSFTKGFAATAYPAAIFMTEDMIFHANIETDTTQDVINELAGHELSHLWWGNNQISPDDREGATVLTESLAMYTEMMLYKKMYGAEEMKERLKIHQQIYDNEKGLSENQPLYKVTDENIHISYSKGALVMAKLSELLGEKQVNLALKNFLLHNQYPKKPTSLDLLEEFYGVSRNEQEKLEIERLFMTL